MLADAGWKVNEFGKLEKDGQPFEITFLSAAEDFRHLNLYIEDLKAVGIVAKIEKINRSTLTKRIDNHEFEMLWVAWGASRLRDPESAWHGSTADQKASQNYPGVKDQEVDRLIELQKTEYDMDKRIEILKQIDARLAEIIPYIFFGRQITQECCTGISFRLLNMCSVSLGRKNPLLPTGGKIRS